MFALTTFAALMPRPEKSAAASGCARLAQRVHASVDRNLAASYGEPRSLDPGGGAG